MHICSNCMRAMRQGARISKLVRTSSRILQTVTTDIRQKNNAVPVTLEFRQFSSKAIRWQQSQPVLQSDNASTQTAIGGAPQTPTQAANTGVHTKAPNPNSPPVNTSSLQNLSSSKLPQASTAEMQRRINQSLNSPRNKISFRLAESLRKTAKSTTESYITYGLTEALFKACAEQAPYTIPEDQRMGVYTGKGPPKNARQEDIGVAEDPNSWWFKDLGLEPTFSVWSQVTFLHMYICTVKLRTLETHKQFLDYQRYLLEHFSNAAEDKMSLLHGMSARGVRNRHLKDLFLQWRGILYAYDQGLVQGDAVLAGAVWRNLWKADEDADWTKIAQVVGFLRRSIAGLAEVDLQDVASGLHSGSQYFKQAQLGLDKVVDAKAVGFREPLSED